MNALSVRLILAATALAPLLGGCSRCGGTDTADTRVIIREDPADILSHPVTFDAQSVDECARLLASGRELTTAEAARVIVTAEAATNHAGQLLEELDRNDDPADTYHVLKELDGQAWPGQLDDIIDGLDNQPLDAPERERADALRKANRRIAILKESLRKK